MRLLVFGKIFIDSTIHIKLNIHHCLPGNVFNYKNGLNRQTHTEQFFLALLPQTIFNARHLYIYKKKKKKKKKSHVSEVKTNRANITDFSLPQMKIISGATGLRCSANMAYINIHCVKSLLCSLTIMLNNFCCTSHTVTIRDIES